MVCPQCEKILISLKVKTKDNEDLEVNGCPSCGGYWLDHWEANEISIKSAEDLTKKFSLIKGVVGNNGSFLCPRCQGQLEALRGENVPLFCQIYRCLQCHGNWFPKDQLLKFKNAQKAKLNYLKVWQIPIASAFTVLLPALILVIITLSIPATVYLTKKNQEQRTQASELVKNINIYQIDKTSVLLVFNTTQPVTSEIEFGRTLSLGERLSVSVTPKTLHQITLRNLKEGTRYYYRIIIKINKKTLSFPLYSFIFTF